MSDPSNSSGATFSFFVGVRKGTTSLFPVRPSRLRVTSNKHPFWPRKSKAHLLLLYLHRFFFAQSHRSLLAVGAYCTHRARQSAISPLVLRSLVVCLVSCPRSESLAARSRCAIDPHKAYPSLPRWTVVHGRVQPNACKCQGPRSSFDPLTVSCAVQCAAKDKSDRTLRTTRTSRRILA